MTDYIRWNTDVKPSVFVYEVAAVGFGNKPLQAKKSCATAQGAFTRFCELVTNDGTIQSTFGNQTWINSDHGGQIKDGEIDLYWGEGDAVKGSDLPKGVTFENIDGSTLLFKKYQTP